jgi:hypothetical protein
MLDIIRTNMHPQLTHLLPPPDAIYSTTYTKNHTVVTVDGARFIVQKGYGRWTVSIPLTPAVHDVPWVYYIPNDILAHAIAKHKSPSLRAAAIAEHCIAQEVRVWTLYNHGTPRVNTLDLKTAQPAPPTIEDINEAIERTHYARIEIIKHALLYVTYVARIEAKNRPCAFSDALLFVVSDFATACGVEVSYNALLELGDPILITSARAV